MDVERLHGHRPPWDEVESGVFGRYDIAMVTLNVITPLNFSATFLHYLNGFAIGYPGEWYTWDFNMDRLFALANPVIINHVNQPKVIASYLTLNVADHPLLDGHDIFVIHPSPFYIEGYEFVQMPVSVVFFRPEGRANLENPLQAT